MHDPDTMAFRIQSPRVYSTTTLKSGTVVKHRHDLVTIWHHDPETDGSDDSCGWSFPKPAESLVNALEGEIRFECRHDPGALAAQRAREGSFAWWLLWLNRASFLDRGRGLSTRHITHEWFTGSFPGSRDDYGVGDDPRRQAWIFARAYLSLVRPWWKHPRWHFWHWRVVLHPWRQLRRWLFVRCSQCGRRFGWHEAPIGYSWSGGGPLVHRRCSTAYEQSRAAERLIAESAALSGAPVETRGEP